MFIEFLASIDKDLTREIFINNVSTLFNIDKSTLNEAINKYSTDTGNRANYSNKKNKIIIPEKKKSFNTIELEILRLIFNQKDDYLSNEDFFNQHLKNEKVLNVKDFIINKDVSKFDQNDDDYNYIFDYISDDTNPIQIIELIDKIRLFEKRQKLFELKAHRKKAKRSTNE